MTETTLTVKQITKAGVAAALAAANAGGSKWLGSGGNTFLQVANADAATCDVTIAGQQTTKQPGVGPVLAPDIVVTVPANTGNQNIGPIPEGYLDSTGYAHVTFEHVNSVTVAAFQLNKVA